MKNFKFAIGVAMLVAGCSTFASIGDVGRSSLVLNPKIIDSTFNTQAIQSLYTTASISHLVLDLKVGAVSKATKDIPNANLANAVVFNNLKENTTYTVQATAYQTAGTTATISVPASSSLTITTTTNNAVTIGTIPVKLLDTPFNGVGTNSIVITPGSFSYAASESIATQ